MHPVDKRVLTRHSFLSSSTAIEFVISPTSATIATRLSLSLAGPTNSLNQASSPSSPNIFRPHLLTWKTSFWEPNPLVLSKPFRVSLCRFVFPFPALALSMPRASCSLLSSIPPSRLACLVLVSRNRSLAFCLITSFS